MPEQPKIRPQQAKTGQTPMRSVVGDVLRLARPYFTAREASGLRLSRLDLSTVSERVVAWTMLALILSINVAQVGVGVLLNQWNGRFYTALQSRNLATFTAELGSFALLAAAFICLAVYELYLTQGLVLRWRAWMTHHFVSKWMVDGVHYRMRLAGDRADNPDQRIAEDVQQFASGSLTIVVQLFSAVLSLVAFAVVLWGLSVGFSYKVGSFDLATIPGYLVWMSLIYAVAGTIGTHLIGRPLVKLDAERQRREADLRFGLARLRENAEPVALLRGESAERDDLARRFQGVYNTLAIMRRRKLLTFFTAGYQQVSVVVPFLLLSPAYFSSAMALGTLTQTSGALGNVQGSLSVFVGLYTILADYRAVVLRLTGFAQAIGHATSAEVAALSTSLRGASLLRLTNYVVSDHQRRARVIVPYLEVRAGERILIMGPSGAGKTTLLRALAGLWPYVSGRSELPDGVRRIVVPQSPYLPWTSLRAAVSYPEADAFSDTEVSGALGAVQLGHLVGRLSEVAPWQRILSAGEAQRLAFARLLLQKPGLVFLDEATSAVDETMEAQLYRTLRQLLPDVAIISIGHRSSLGPLHDCTLMLELDDEGSYRLSHRKPAHSEPNLAA